MKKVLLTLIVTMLTCLGAWAQETILIDGGADGITSGSDFKLDAAKVPASIQAGDVLKLDYDITASWSYYIGVSFGGNPVFWLDSNNKGSSSDEYTLGPGDVDAIKSNGISAAYGNLYGLKINKLSLFHYDAPESVSLNEESITLGIGSTYNLLKATVNPSTASQTVTWSVVKVDESDPEVITVNATTGVIEGIAAGTAKVRATVASNTELYVDCEVTVKQGYTLSLSTTDNTTVLNTTSGTITLTPTVGLEGQSPEEGTDYNIVYTIKDNADPTNVKTEGNVVNIAEGATAGTYTVVATLNPTVDTYAGATATMDFVVDAPVENAIHLTIGDQTFGKSDGVKNVAGGLTIDNDIFGSNTTFTFKAKSDNENVVVAAWKGKDNQHNNNVDFTIVGAGETDVTLTVDAVNTSGKVTTTTKTIHVVVAGDPLKFTMSDLTINDDQELTLDAIKAAITKVYTEVNSTQTDVDPANYQIEVYKDDAKVETSIPAQGSGVSSFEITVNVKATNVEYADATPKTVNVTVTHKKSFVVNPILGKTTLKANGHETTTITPTSKYNGEDVAVTYAFESSDPTVATVSPEGVITAQKAGTVTINVTAIPEDDENYARMYATSDVITVNQSYVTITKENIGGKEYVVVDVPEGGAFGDMNSNPDVSLSSIANAIAELKGATNVKVTGYIANSDVQELVYLIGGDDSNCKTLDMGDATMTEPITKTNVGTETAPVYKCSLVGGIGEDGYVCTKSMIKTESITLPKPATGSTVLSENTNALFSAWNNSATNELKSLTIPEGWTELATGCFGKTDDAQSGQGLANATSVKLPTTLKAIDAYAFAYSPNLVDVNFDELTNLTTLGAHAFEGCTALTEADLSKTKITEVGDYCFNSDNYIETVKCPSTLVRIGKYAFYGEPTSNTIAAGEYCTGTSLKYLELNEGLVTIDDYAFAHSKIEKLVIPSTVNVIGDHTFANYGGKNSFKDIFFTGVTAPEYVHTDAFTSSTQKSNNSHNSALIGADGSAVRETYNTDNGWMCILHYPGGLTPEQEATYRDMSRVYAVQGDHYNKTVEETITRTEAIEKYNMSPAGNLVTYQAWTPEQVAILEGLGLGASTGVAHDGSCEVGYPDRSLGDADVWPSQAQYQASYESTKHGYFWNATAMDATQLKRQGIYQFTIAKADAPRSTTTYTFDASYESDLWWTICVPFNMSIEQIKKVFGEDTQVCRLEKVIRDTSNPENQTIKLKFTKSVMVESGENIKYPDNVTIPGIRAHYSYMIKPKGATGTDAVYSITEGGKVKRQFPNYDWVNGGPQVDQVTAVESDDENASTVSGMVYQFVGNYLLNGSNGDEIKVPQYSYFWGWSKSNPRNNRMFYFEVSAERNFSKNAAVLQTVGATGAADFETFFKDKLNNGEAPAPALVQVFGDEEATSIENVEIICGDDKVNDDKVYTINGVLVNGNSLPAGLYIKNGKKFIVK